MIFLSESSSLTQNLTNEGLFGIEIATRCAISLALRSASGVVDLYFYLLACSGMWASVNFPIFFYFFEIFFTFYIP